MSYAEDLWDRWDVLVKRLEDGFLATEAVAKAFNKRARAEEAYAKAMNDVAADLGKVKGLTNTTAAAVTQLAEHHRSLAQHHSSFAKIARKDLVPATLQMKEKMKKSLAETDKKHAAMEAEKVKHVDLQRKAHKAGKPQPPPLFVKEENDKKKELYNKAAGERLKLKAESLDDMIQETEAQHQERVTPLFQTLQSMDVGRLQHLKKTLNEFVHFESEMFQAVQDDASKTGTAAEGINVAQDLYKYIGNARSNEERPGHISEYIFVTGATGRLAKHLLNSMAEQEDIGRIGVGTRKMRSLTQFLHIPMVEVVECDATDPSTLSSAFRHVTTLVIVVPATPDAGKMVTNYVDAAKRDRVRRIVLVSVHTALQTTSVWKDAEKAVINSGITYTVVRSNIWMQNFTDLLGTDIAGRGELVGAFGSGKATFVDYRDVSVCLLAIILREGHNNQIYTLTGPKAMTGKEMAAVFSKEMQFEVTYVDMKPADLKKYLVEIKGVDPALAETWVAYNNAVRTGRKGEDKEALDNATKHVARITSGEEGVESLMRQRPLDFDDFVEDHADTLLTGALVY